MADLDPVSIRLRQLEPNDVTDRYVAWLSDPDVTRFLEIRYSQPFDTDTVRAFVESCIESRRHHWGIFVRGEHVGNVSCSHYDRRNQWVDISCIIGEREFRGSVVAKLSVASALDHLFTVAGMHRIQTGTWSVHIQSICFVADLGFRKEATLREAIRFEGRYVDLLKFALLKDEWWERGVDIPRVMVEPMSWEPQPAEATDP